MTDLTDKVERSIARFERVTRQLDERDGPTRAAAARERQRLNSAAMVRVRQIVAALAIIAVLTIVVGIIKPIGMFGFLGAMALGLATVVVLALRGGRQFAATPAPSTDLPNGAMVERFDSYIYRVRRGLPAPALAQLDAISQLTPSLKQTLGRLDTFDPTAQDARRLMSIHLPGLIDRYQRVPAAYRKEMDGENKTVDQRLVEGLAAGRAALADVSEQLARADVAALETQGRFIESRYGQSGPGADNPAPVTTNSEDGVSR